MEKLAVTRFNKNTWNENIIWRNSLQYNGCIYNTPIKISEKILPDTIIFVLEMNNSLNKIEGIGLIKNHIDMYNKYKIYKEKNYNRYTYKSKYRIARNELSREEEKIINILDILLFKGNRHMKRGQGIQIIPKWIEKNSIFNFNKFIKKIFINKFTETKDNIF